jgi:hypothetical protein
MDFDLPGADNDRLCSHQRRYCPAPGGADGYVPLEETRRIRIAFPRARLVLSRSSQEEAICRSKKRGASGSPSPGLVWF